MTSVSAQNATVCTEAIFNFGMQWWFQLLSTVQSEWLFIITCCDWSVNENLSRNALFACSKNNFVISQRKISVQSNVAKGRIADLSPLCSDDLIRLTLTPSIHGSLGPPESANQMTSGLVQLFLQGSRIWPTERLTKTDRLTYRPHYSICKNRSYLMYWVLAMLPKNKN